MASFDHALRFFVSSFTENSRADGSSFLCLKPDSPEWMRTAIMLAHDEEWPNNSRYTLIRDALQSLSDYSPSNEEEARDVLWDIAINLIPVYTSELLGWFSANPSRLFDCDSAAEETGESYNSVVDLLSEGYRFAVVNTLSILISEIEENRASIFNPDTDCRLILSGSHGIYIPQMFCSGLSEDDAEAMGVDWRDVQICQSGPDEECYWDAWQAVLDSAEITESATFNEEESTWRLLQNGDLWQVRSDVELPDDWLFA